MPHQLVFTLGITCQNCVGTVNIALRELNFLEHGLSNQRIDLTQKKLFIDYDPTQTQFDIKAVQQKIIDTIDSYGIECQMHAIEKPKRSYHWLLGAIGLSAGLALMMLTFFTGGLTLPWMLAIGIGSSALTVLLGYNSFINAYVHARYSRTMTMDTLFTISTLTVLAVSLTSIFIPGLPIMFEAGLMLFGFRHIGLAIEEAINHKTGVQQNFTDRIAKKIKLTTGQTIETSQIQVNDEIFLANGQVLPVDGSFINATPNIRNDILTGHDHPYKTTPNQVINAGAVIEDANQTFIFKAHQSVGNSYLAKLDNLLLSAQQNKAPIEQYTDKLLNYFIPGVLAIALLSGLVIGFWISPIMAVQCAATVLVTACPCTLGMIVPMTMKIGMQKGLNHGVAFQTREAIEQATHINQVVFDLNGTLTQGTPQVKQCEISPSFPNNFLFQILLKLEKKARHPVGKCLAAYAKTQWQGLDNPIFNMAEVDDLHNGRKLRITINEQSQEYCIGNAQCMREQGIELNESDHQPRIYLAENQRIIAQFVVIDPLRKGALQVVNQLQKSGKSVYLLTGADDATAHFYGGLLGISKSNLFANQSPEEKQLLIQRLQQTGPVAMVGDGANDAVALGQSDLGIAMHSHLSDAMTNQQAKVLISDYSVLPIGHLFQIAHQTMSTLKQNLGFSLAYNVAALLLTGGVLTAIGFAMNPAVGAGLMVLQTSMILLNTYRLTYQELPSPHPAVVESVSSNRTLSQLQEAPVYNLDHRKSPHETLVSEVVETMQPACPQPTQKGGSHDTDITPRGCGC
ncbi:heavy metal translocating P-type ATPase [Legionella sp. W05-934-2]|uniref:heavy metal translocating P-type ATPase n=1 Tax=Legionella sp. W05-934-2 TaxID=1198649 RepID=UPI003462CFFD